MQHPRAQVAVALALLFASVTRLGLADPSDSSTPRTVELILVGAVQGDLSLSHRVRSLFEPEVRFTTDKCATLNRDAVLRPPSSGTLYLWITLTATSSARVYVATREDGSDSTRYLYREVALPTSLDEMGSETLAQVAHSSARALWAREQQTSRAVVLSAIDADAVPKATQPAPATVASTGQENPTSASPTSSRGSAPAERGALHTQGTPPPRDLRSQGAPLARASAAPTPLRFSLAADYTTYASGGEGWLDEVGGSFSAVWRDRYSVRGSAAYLLTQQFEAALTRVSLNGFSADLRLGWRSPTAGGFGAQLEAGLGVLAARYSAHSAPPAVARPGESQQRFFTSGVVGCEWDSGALTLAARFELRVPFREIDYVVLGGANGEQSIHTWLNPGFALEVGIPLNRLF